MFTIGIDYGTNSVRALIVRCADGKEFGSCVFNYPSGHQGVMLDPRDHNVARQHPGDYLLGLEKTVKGALAQAKVEVHQRLQVQPGQRGLDAGLDAGVARDEVAGHRLVEPSRDTRRRRRDHAVDDHGDAPRRRAQDEPGQRGVLQTADCGQHSERIGRVRAVQGQGTLDHGDLPGQHVVAGAGPAAHVRAVAGRSGPHPPPQPHGRAARPTGCAAAGPHRRRPAAAPRRGR